MRLLLSHYSQLSHESPVFPADRESGFGSLRCSSALPSPNTYLLSVPIGESANSGACPISAVLHTGAAYSLFMFSHSLPCGFCAVRPPLKPCLPATRVPTVPARVCGQSSDII